MFRYSFAILLLSLLVISMPENIYSTNENQFAEGIDQQPPEARSTTFKYARWTPGVIYVDGNSKTNLEVWTKGDIESMELVSGSLRFGLLNDDGLDADKKAGDNIWTYKGFTREYTTYWFPGYSSYGTSVIITRTDGTKEEVSMPSIGFAEKKNYQAVKVKTNFYATKYAAFIVDKKGRMLGGKMPLSDVTCGKGNELVFKTFYQGFGDLFDFLAVMPAVAIYHPDDYRENVPYCVPVQNKVQNIGVPIFNKTAQFGSRGKLKAVIYHSFGSGAIFDHEWGHNWGVRIGDALHFSGENNIYHGGDTGWHYTSYANQVGQMGSLPQLKLEKNDDGTYKATKVFDEAEKHLYTPLTLYQMGLVPASKVPPVKILRNHLYPDFEGIPENEFDTYTIQQIMAANGGERIPAYPNTQKKFRMALIVVSDRKFTQAEYDYFSSMAKYLGSKENGNQYVTPFYATTGGRAKLNTRLPKVK